MKIFSATLLFCILTFRLCAQLPESEVWLFDYSAKKNLVNILSGINISNNKGYDNQPFFAADSKSLLWTSQRDSGQTDIFSYSIPDKLSLRLTQTSVSEYSPEFIPGDHYFSCVVVEKDSTQRLWKYNLHKYDTTSKPSELVLPDIKDVAYSRWFSNEMVMLCLLPEPMTLSYVNPTNESIVSYAKNVGRSMQHVCVKKNDWFLYTQMQADSGYYIMAMNGLGKSTQKFPPVQCPPNSQDFTVDKNGHILMASGTKIYSWTIGKSKTWTEIADMKNAGLHKITRMMISPDGKHISLVDNLP